MADINLFNPILARLRNEYDAAVGNYVCMFLMQYHLVQPDHSYNEMVDQWKIMSSEGDIYYLTTRQIVKIVDSGLPLRVFKQWQTDTEESLDTYIGLWKNTICPMNVGKVEDLNS
jgi:hypothetical protein